MFTIVVQTFLVVLITGLHIHFVGPTTWSTKYHEPHGGPSVSGGTSGSSTVSLVSGSTTDMVIGVAVILSTMVLLLV